MSESPSRGGFRAGILTRAWMLSTWSVASFAALFVVSTQLHGVRAHSPWADDPYDAVLSVAGLVLPFVWAVTSARLLRRRAASAIPAAAARTILRGAGVVLLLVWASSGACLAALTLHARHDAWGPWLGWLVALVAATGLSALVATAELARTARRLRPAGLAGGSGRPWAAEPDAIDDVAALLDTAGRSLARISSRLGRLLAFAGTALATVGSSRWGPRRHRITWCLGLALSFGAALAAWHGIAEGVPPTGPTAILVGAVFTSAGAVIVVVSYACLGTYLRLIRPERRPGRR
jgi:hypothetical protein